MLLLRQVVGSKSIRTRTKQEIPKMKPENLAVFGGQCLLYEHPPDGTPARTAHSYAVRHWILKLFRCGSCNAVVRDHGEGSKAAGTAFLYSAGPKHMLPRTSFGIACITTPRYKPAQYTPAHLHMVKFLPLLQ